MAAHRKLLLAAAGLLFAALSASVASAQEQSTAEELIALHKNYPLNLFSKHVFDPSFYRAKYPSLREQGVVDAKTARKHWVNFGIKQGLQGCPFFKSRVYLEKNADVRDQHGPDNYPLAMIHYLTVGLHELWRETGGPERMSIFDPKAFDADYYIMKNNLKSVGVGTKKAAMEHWRDVGLREGLQASPHFNVKAYLNNNIDLIYKFGANKSAHRPALAHWLSEGYLQTWRDAGGSTCKYWATWCVAEDTVFDFYLHNPLPLPVYNSTTYKLSDPPVPRRAGHTVTVNGRECEDMDSLVDLRSDSTRIEVIHIHSPGKAGKSRPCSVYLRQYVDIQTRIQDRSPPELSITNWIFWNALNPGLESKAIATPKNMIYEGYNVDHPPQTQPNATGTFNGTATSKTLNVTVTAVSLEDPATKLPDDNAEADADHMPPHEIFELSHLFDPDPTADQDGDNVGNADKSDRGFMDDVIEEENGRRYSRLPTPPPGYVQAHIAMPNYPYRPFVDKYADSEILHPPRPPPPQPANASDSGNGSNSTNTNTNATSANGESSSSEESSNSNETVTPINPNGLAEYDDEGAEKAPPAPKRNTTASANTTATAGSTNATASGNATTTVPPATNATNASSSNTTAGTNVSPADTNSTSTSTNTNTNSNSTATASSTSSSSGTSSTTGGSTAPTDTSATSTPQAVNSTSTPSPSH